MAPRTRAALLAMALGVGGFLVVAATLGGGAFRASADPGHPHKVFVPLASADKTGAQATLTPIVGCSGDIATYLHATGADAPVEKFQVEGTGIVVEWFHFTNPCDDWIAPQRMDVNLTGDFGSLDASIGAFPSLVPPGGDGYFALYYNQALFDEAGLEYPEEQWTWEQLAEIAKILTVDANGNDATSPDFDPELIVQSGYQASVTASHQGNPVVWPFSLALRGECPDGSAVFGHFTPYEYGYNPGGLTSFDGYVSWLPRGCTPEEAFAVLGYLLGDDFVANAAGAQPDELFTSNLTLTQTSPGLMRLAGSVTNTGQVPGRPLFWDVDLLGDNPVSSQYGGFDMYFPGEVGEFFIEMAGNVEDYTGIVVTIPDIQLFPDAIVPTWYAPPTYLWDGTGPVEVYNAFVVNTGPLVDAYGEGGTLTGRHWRYKLQDQVRFSDGNITTPFNSALSAIALAESLSPGPEYASDAALWEAITADTFRLDLATTHSSQEYP